MDIKQRLKSLLQEAEIYRSQGLIVEAHGKYKDASGLVNSIANLKNKASLLRAIQEKIEALDDTKEKVEKGPTSPELSKKAQDLIKNLFVFSENKNDESAALEGAVALAKFGQFDRALKELEPLLAKDGVKIEAAKNILRCHLAAGSAQEAIDQYRSWHTDDRFQSGQLEQVRIYLDDALQKKGVDVTLPKPVSTGETMGLDSDVATAAEDAEEEFLDITSIGITFETGPRVGKMVEFDVNFQSGNMLSLIISKQDQSIIEDLKAGMELKDIQFYSPIAIFNGTGVVSSKTQIKSGPKQGDYCLDIRIKST